QRHPGRTLALLLVSPVYGGNEAGLLPAQLVAMERMRAAGERALAEGIEALFPLFEGLPPAVRGVALALVRRVDPESVAATTRFLGSGVHPFERMSDLAALRVPTLVAPGTDPEHPAEIAEAYARALPTARLVRIEGLGPALEALLQELKTR